MCKKIDELIEENAKLKQELKTMVDKLNESLMPKLRTTSSRAELVKRIHESNPHAPLYRPYALKDCDISELKSILSSINKTRA